MWLRSIAEIVATGNFHFKYPSSGHECVMLPIVAVFYIVGLDEQLK